MTSKLKAFQNELINAILDEDKNFDMSYFQVGRGTIPTCGTARCMGGHIVALRRDRAKQLVKEYRCDVEECAIRIWEEETGAPCRLDFYATRHTKKPLGPEITRKEAIAHIRGRSKVWPLLRLRAC